MNDYQKQILCSLYTQVKRRVEEMNFRQSVIPEFNCNGKTTGALANTGRHRGKSASHVGRLQSALVVADPVNVYW